MSLLARPHLSGWLEHEQGHTVAVCEATGKPAASIHWETPWNTSATITQASNNVKQLPTVTSRLYLPHNASYSNLSCVATSSAFKHTVTRFSSFTYRVAWVVPVTTGSTAEVYQCVYGPDPADANYTWYKNDSRSLPEGTQAEGNRLYFMHSSSDLDGLYGCIAISEKGTASAFYQRKTHDCLLQKIIKTGESTLINPNV
ncbi:hypothetical protein Baya_16285 [Bagarius yarrelli]|uniref:Ig-like domain-containing protein n=1 Tax=Bagarius yarrelli TaxID=175774 RepID=A0A556VUW3_BAGYA|nr:hypothetical protein Baya_16285 [Bagarius yarrelli]